MVLVLPVGLALVAGILLGGDPRRLVDVRLRLVWLFYAAMALQVVAFPFSFLPWHTGDRAGVVLWLASYGLLVGAALANLRVRGVPIVAAGMLSNVAAVLANGGHMPTLPQALRALGKGYLVHFNSAEMASPNLPWLVDRWAVPAWIPLGNVYSVGDVVIAIGAVVVVVAAMGVRLPRTAQAATPAPNFERR